MSAQIVTCARCLATYREDDPDVLPIGGDWFCRDEVACGDGLGALLEATDGI